MTRRIYRKPEITSHEAITFETQISSRNGGGGNCGGGGSGSGGGCFIAIACLEAKGPNCEDLADVKWLRNEILMATDEGKQIVEKLYEMTPQIMKKIGRENEAAAIYRRLYTNLVLKSVELIKAGKMDEARSNYFAVMAELEKEYLTPTTSTVSSPRISPALSL